MTSASLVMASTTGLACEKADGIPTAGAPCRGLAVTQQRDLSFSIQPAGCAGAVPDRARNGGPRTIAIGDSLKADSTIFTRLVVEGKEVSDAHHR